MARDILPEAKIHPSVRQQVATYKDSRSVREVQSAIAEHDVVVVGMSQNPFPGRARRLLESKGIAHKYLGYGSYLSQWRVRLPLKMWSGWSTFPMIFVKGTLIGGFRDLAQLLASGEFQQLLHAPRE